MGNSYWTLDGFINALSTAAKNLTQSRHVWKSTNGRTLAMYAARIYSRCCGPDEIHKAAIRLHYVQQILSSRNPSASTRTLSPTKLRPIFCLRGVRLRQTLLDCSAFKGASGGHPSRGKAVQGKASSFFFLSTLNHTIIMQCSHERCPAAFPKHHQLRAHTASEHAPSGTKPYQCDHGDCTKSFSTNQKLHAHLKVHEGIWRPVPHYAYPYLIALLKKGGIRARILPAEPNLSQHFILPGLHCSIISVRHIRRLVLAKSVRGEYFPLKRVSGLI